jgi:arylsulfatase
MRKFGLLLSSILLTTACDAADKSVDKNQLAVPITAVTAPSANNNKIVHDADYYVLEAQHGKQWTQDDKTVDQKLAAFRQTNGGKPMGIPELNAIRGYKTPNINKLADQSMRFSSMYTEPSCTPTRVAFMTGRQPHRNGMGDTAVDIAGFGLNKDEVTLAETLSASGFNTVHIGKWHMGDIMESWPNQQGFDFASFPIHQQGQLSIYNDDAAFEEVSIGIGKGNYDDRFTKDHWFRPDPSHMATVVEGKRGETVREVHMKPGERWTQKKYDEMNERFQKQALEQLRILAKKDKPFFLNYWPLIPVTGPRTTETEFTTPNGGTYVEKMKQMDGWVGEIMAEMTKLGLDKNTIVVLMGDNGHFTKYSPGSGFTPMIFRGGKGYTTEGGVRVDAFARWPGMIEADSIVGDIVHVADLFTSLSKIGNAADKIPTDRIIDGVDQTALMLEGETHGRRDTVFIYSGNSLKAVVKERFKLEVPGAGENAIIANFYDLYRDTREEWPVSTEVGAWGGNEMVRVAKYPDTKAGFGRPYEGIENLRPETKAAVEAFLVKQASSLK